MDGPPPPPPPHGENPKSTLPPGNWEIYVIPQHKKGVGVLYLPSLETNVNSFVAGFASALLVVIVWQITMPYILMSWNNMRGSGGSGMVMLVIAIGCGAWLLGRAQTNPTAGAGPAGGQNTWGSPPSSGTSSNEHAGPPPGYGTGPTPGAGPMPGTGAPPPGAGAGQRSQWQQRSPPPGSNYASGGNQGPDPSTSGGGTAGASARSAWEKAREDTKRKEEERKAREADARRKAEIERKLREAREKDAREREAREKKRRDDEAAAAEAKRSEELRQAEIKRKEEEARRQEEEAREKRQKEEEALEKKRKDIEALEQRLKEVREKEAKERAVRESKLKYEAAKERIRKELDEKRKKDEALREQMRKDTEARAAKRAEDDSKPRGSMYAFSAVGEKTNPWPQGRPATPPRTAPVSPPKKVPPPATAKTFKGTEDETYSYRPYDKPKNPMHKKSLSSLYSESSYAASQSTSRTTPPPSRREPYTNKDPTQIIIKAVYAYMPRAYKTPCSQLISGVGNVTDGLILKFETEGLFIDDDVRGVGQREWDAKAWGLKLLEVWCPSFRQSSASVPLRVSPFASSSSPATKKQNAIRRLWGLDNDKAASAEELDTVVSEMRHLCSTNCRSSTATPSSPSSSNNANKNVNSQQTGEVKGKKLHILRVTIRDPDGKRFVFIIDESESWKIALGIQKLRKSSLIRSMGVSGMSTGDARSTLEGLGWG